MRCGVCSHPLRGEIERATAGGGEETILAVARTFGVSKAALTKHQSHPRATAPAEALPHKSPRGRGRAPSSWSSTVTPAKLEQLRAKVAAASSAANDDDEPDDDLEDIEESPATSRSPESGETEIVSSRPSGTALTARSHLDGIFREIGTLLKDANVKVRDRKTNRIGFRYSLAERSSVLRAALSSVRLLAMLTGELGASEAVIASSPHWRRLEGELLGALRDHPEAMKSVAAVLQKKRDAA